MRAVTAAMAEVLAGGVPARLVFEFGPTAVLADPSAAGPAHAAV